ncbi:methionyl-tRNA formyltransferase [Acidithiobacillus sp. IBUN Pt1247-S3]|uniref:methionyl-tRNA formyltransferase n=1 Tax=Acidithiobacillus sp. IBUN Pt1247-S3 TaxID=3166642 RepID=UPI0034E3D444
MAEGRRIVFAGTPDFAERVLARLLARHEEIVGVVTQPDRPAGRGRKLQASPVKALALQAGLPILQPESSRAPETLDWLRNVAPDLLIVVAFGQILPQAILDTPRLGAINVHASLLPAWRGAAPIVRALAAGDSETGICIMQMEAGLDSGPVLWTRKTPILDTDTGASLHDRLAELGADALAEALDRLWLGELQAVPQDHEQVSYAKKLRKEEAHIDWSKDAATLARLVRAYNPYPVTHTGFREQPLRVWSARLGNAAGTPGTLIVNTPEGPEVACGRGSLVLTRVQPAGKAQLSGGDFGRGYRLQEGEVFA